MRERERREGEGCGSQEVEAIVHCTDHTQPTYLRLLPSRGMPCTMPVFLGNQESKLERLALLHAALPVTCT